MTAITPGEYNALRAIWPYTPTARPKGVRFDTLCKLVKKGLLAGEFQLGMTDSQYWLTDAGKTAMDEYPHLARMKQEPQP